MPGEGKCRPIREIYREFEKNIKISEKNINRKPERNKKNSSERPQNVGNVLGGVFDINC
jgi:hypothetical protein